MRRWIAVTVVVLALAGCGSPASETAQGEGHEGEGQGREGEGREGEGHEGEGREGVGHEGEPQHTSTPATPSCDRVRPCIEAFVEVAPSALADSARVALDQLDVSLAESPAREPACAAALASYRHDLEANELEVPETCR